MPRYIDADILKKHGWVLAKIKTDKNGVITKIMSMQIDDAPTADVVPKSEYDAVASNGVLQLHDYYFEWQEAVREIENLKVLLEMKDVSYEGLKELYDTDTTALIEAREKTEVEVAREIFEEIERKSCVISETNHFTGSTRVVCHQISAEKLAELKKKYTEEQV